MRVFSFCLSVFAVAAVAFAQDAPDGSGLKKHKKPVPAAALSKKPVTKQEAAATFLRVEKIFHTVLPGARAGAPSHLRSTSEPVTRAEAVAELNRLFTLVQPTFTINPRKVSYDAKRITLKDPTQRQNLEKLIAYGCVAKIGPIATNPGPTLTVHEFGDAVGFFISRVAELTNLPSSKWTPYLHGDD